MKKSKNLRYCVNCNKNHYLTSIPGLICFGIVSEDWDLFYKSDKVMRSFTSIKSYNMSLQELNNEFKNFLGIGLTVQGVQN